MIAVGMSSGSVTVLDALHRVQQVSPLWTCGERDLSRLLTGWNTT